MSMLNGLQFLSVYPDRRGYLLVELRFYLPKIF